eukprot:314545_1
MSAKCGKPKSSLWKYATVQPSESGKPKAKFKRLKRTKEYQKYCLFAQELIQIAGNAVKLETSFKTVRIVHNQWRRSLRKDRLAKLVKCHYNIPNIEKVKGMPIV